MDSLRRDFIHVTFDVVTQIAQRIRLNKTTAILFQASNWKSCLSFEYLTFFSSLNIASVHWLQVGKTKFLP